MENPILDWANAAMAWGMGWDDFTDLPGERQSFLVAVYRTNRQIDAVLAYEQHRKMKQAAKKKTPKRK